MRLSAIAAAAILLAAATPAKAGGLGDSHGVHGANHRHVHRHPGRHYHHRGHRAAAHAPVVIASEPPLYREPYLPRGVLYNAPPLPVYSGYAEQVVRARY